MAQVQRKRPAKNKAAVAKQNMRDYLIMALVMVVIVGGIIAVNRWRNRVPGVTATAFSTQETFLHGVQVNGIDLGGMTYDEGLATVEKQISDRLSQPINVRYNGKTYTRTPAQLGVEMVGLDRNITEAWAFGHTGNEKDIARAYKYIQDGNEVAFDCKLKIDDEQLQAFVNEVAVNVNVRPVNASIEVDASQLFEITEHVEGVQVNEAKLKQDITYVLNAGTSANIDLKPDRWPPEYTTEMMYACTFKLSEATTNAASSNANRTRNIMRALEPFKTFIVMPEQHVSFNEVVGPRTVANGFYEAPEIVGGQLTDGIGGGTCQASTTLMQALVEAGFTIDERHQHSLRVSYCKPSQDATVTDSGKVKDLKFTNNTKSPMYIFATCTWKEAKVVVYGMKSEYKIKLKTRTVTKDIPWKGWTPEVDIKRKYVKEPGQKELKKDGVYGCITEGVRAYYDWDTGEHIEGMDETLWRDEYAPVKPVYYVYE